MHWECNVLLVRVDTSLIIPLALLSALLVPSTAITAHRLLFVRVMAVYWDISGTILPSTAPVTQPTSTTSTAPTAQPSANYAPSHSAPTAHLYQLVTVVTQATSYPLLTTNATQYYAEMAKWLAPSNVTMQVYQVAVIQTAR